MSNVISYFSGRDYSLRSVLEELQSCLHACVASFGSDNSGVHDALNVKHR